MVEAWRKLKSASEELRLLIAEKHSAIEANVLYGQWMEFYEAFLQANDTYCCLLGDGVGKEHSETWFQDNNSWLSNIKSTTEKWFFSKVEEQSGASRQS